MNDRSGSCWPKSGICDQALPLGSMTVGPIVLMKSHLRPTGPVYTKLWEVV